jgi:hypothetical protein
LKKFKTNEIFNISDDQPASQEEVAVYGALLLKMNKPNPLKIEDLEEGMLKDFYKESKKVLRLGQIQSKKLLWCSFNLLS